MIGRLLCAPCVEWMRTPHALIRMSWKDLETGVLHTEVATIHDLDRVLRMAEQYDDVPDAQFHLWDVSGQPFMPVAVTMKNGTAVCRDHL